jgi:hypothetical protein
MQTHRLLTLGSALGALVLISAPAAAQCPGTDDAFEDNDTCGTPWTVTAGQHQGLYTEKEAADQDYFLISVPSNHRVTVTISFAHSQADIDMRLWDLGCANQLDGSFSTGDSEEVGFVNTTGATLDVVAQVYVYVNSVIDCNTYDMDIAVFPDPCITNGDDTLEDNDDCSTAISGVTGVYPGLFVSKFDLDYYDYALADGDEITVNAFFTHANGDIDIILYDVGACGGGLGSGLTQGASLDDNETLTYVNTTGANRDVVLEVNVWINSTFDCNDHDLEVVINAGAGPIGTNYCGPANLNSSGLPALISAFGIESAAANDVRLDATQLAMGQFGMFVNSMSQGFVTPPGSQGNLCLSGGIGRHKANIMNSGATGEFSLQLDLTSVPTPGAPVSVQPGETWYWQAWFRDNNPTSTSNFTDGIGITFV